MIKATTYIAQETVIVTIKNLDLDVYLSDYDETHRAGNLVMMRCGDTSRRIMETQAKIRGLSIPQYVSNLVISALTRDTLRLAIQH